MFSPCRHFRRFHFPCLVRHFSTFLRPFAPGPLRPFFALTDALSPAPPVLRPLSKLERRSLPVQVSPLHAFRLPTIPSPNTLRPFTAAVSLTFRRGESPSSWVQASPLGKRARRDRLAVSSSSSYGLVVHLPLLPTPPRGDAVTVGYRLQLCCLWRGLPPLCLIALAGALPPPL